MKKYVMMELKKIQTKITSADVPKENKISSDADYVIFSYEELKDESFGIRERGRYYIGNGKGDIAYAVKIITRETIYD